MTENPENIPEEEPTAHEYDCFLEETDWDDDLADELLLQEDLKGQELPEKSWIADKRIRKQADIFAKRREQAEEELAGNIPEIGGCTHMVVVGNWDYWHIPETILNMYKPGQINELFIATWAFNRPTLLALRDQIERLKCPITFMQNWRNERRNPSENYLLLATVQKYDGYLIKLNQHCKIFLIDAAPNYYTVAGSANLTENNNMEQCCVFNDKNTFDFYKNVFLSFKRHKIILPDEEKTEKK